MQYNNNIMAQTVLITLTTAGTDTGPFDLYSDADGYVTPFETGVSKVALTGGYTSTLVPDAATIIRVQSDSDSCTNYVDLTIVTTTTTTTSTSTTTTTTTSTSTSTTTTTTTAAPNDFSGSIEINNGTGAGQLATIFLNSESTPFVFTAPSLAPGVPGSEDITVSPSSQSSSVTTFTVSFSDAGPNNITITDNAALIDIYSPVITDNNTTYVKVTWTIPSGLGMSLVLSGQLQVSGG
jgi:hypothetical protein